MNRADQEDGHSTSLSLPCSNLVDFRNGRNVRPTVGRQAMFDEIDELFLDTGSSVGPGKGPLTPPSTLKVFTVHGGEGMGKSHVARAYAIMREAKFDVVFWIDASTESSMTAGLRAFANRLGLPVAKTASPELDPIVKNAVENWLSNPINFGSRVSWLLILDAANDLNVISDVWPHMGQGCLLLTTRQPAIQSIFKTNGRRLGPLTFDDAAEMLLNLVETEKDECAMSDAKTIARFWEGIPICMELVNSVMKSSGLTLSEFAATQKDRKNEYLLKKPLYGSRKTAGIFDALSQQLAQVAKSKGEGELALLLIISFLDGSGIHESVLKNFPEVPTLEDYPQDQSSYQKSRTRLWETSVIDYDGDKKIIRLLGTVQDAVLGVLGPASDMVFHGFVFSTSLVLSAWPCNITIETSFSRLDTKDRWQRCAQLILHVNRLWDRYLDLDRSRQRNCAVRPFAQLLTEAAW